MHIVVIIGMVLGILCFEVSVIFKDMKDFIAGKPLVKRSSKWPKLRADHLKDNGFCQVCGGTEKLEVHHIYPVHLYPSSELDPTNLMTLCESKRFGINCHLFCGHKGNYKKFNLLSAYDAYALGRVLK